MNLGQKPELDSFLHDLHFAVDRTRPPDFEPDWDDAPLPYKIYRGLPAVELSPEIPLELVSGKETARPDLRGIGNLLWCAYGLTQLSQYVNGPTEPTQVLRRFIPSGGALYPCEVYVYLKPDDFRAGVYHYDAAHHRLVRIREGNFDSYLKRALGNRCEMSACFGAVLVTSVFWKNFFKYHHFAYRLQGLDAGALLGQLLESSGRLGFESAVCFQFLDRALNHLLGNHAQEESVYAVVPLSVHAGDSWFRKGTCVETRESSEELCRELAEVCHPYFVRSKRILPYPMLSRMNEASHLETSDSFQLFGAGGGGETYERTGLKLPKVDRLFYDLLSASRKRYSPGSDFVAGTVGFHELAALLEEACEAFRYRNDLDGMAGDTEDRVFIYGCLHHVDCVPDGAYRYDAFSHSLLALRSGDHRLRLMYGTPPEHVNLYHVPLCLHVSGARSHHKPVLGYRGYRIQQMEAGMLMQRLILAASALELRAHPLLAFDANDCDEIYRMEPNGLTSLVQVAIGPTRPRPRLQGGLHG